jgi:hypothetical protein
MTFSLAQNGIYMWFLLISMTVVFLLSVMEPKLLYHRSCKFFLLTSVGGFILADGSYGENYNFHRLILADRR